MAVPRLRVPNWSPGRLPAAGRGPCVGRGRALPPHVHDPAALVGRDAAARARAVASLDELEPAPARLDQRGRPRRVPVRDAPAARGRVGDRGDRHGAGGAGLRARRGGRIQDWEPVEAPARRRRWFDSHEGTMAVLLASTSDLDDVIPTLVAYQVEWNKLHAILRSTDRPEGDELDPAACAEAYGGNAEDWIRVREAWGDLSTFLDEVRGRKLNLRIRMLGGSQAGYARMTRRWWRPVRTAMEEQGLGERPVYFVSSNPHSMVNLVTPTARSGEAEIVRFIEEHGPAVPARGARALPRGPRRGLVGEPPLLRRAAAVGVAARGRRAVAPPPGGRARARRHAHLQQGGPARLVADHGARPPRPRGPRPPARPGGRRAARALERRDRQRRVPARPRRLQHPARAHRVDRRGPRRLRARQGRDPERRRRRRADLRASSTTSTRARPTGSTTRSRSTTSRRSCASARGSTTSAR